MGQQDPRRVKAAPGLDPQPERTHNMRGAPWRSTAPLTGEGSGPKCRWRPERRAHGEDREVASVIDGGGSSRTEAPAGGAAGGEACTVRETLGLAPEWIEEGEGRPRVRGIKGKLTGVGGFGGGRSWGRKEGAATVVEGRGFGARVWNEAGQGLKQC